MRYVRFLLPVVVLSLLVVTVTWWWNAAEKTRELPSHVPVTTESKLPADGRSQTDGTAQLSPSAADQTAQMSVEADAEPQPIRILADQAVGRDLIPAQEPQLDEHGNWKRARLVRGDQDRMDRIEETLQRGEHGFEVVLSQRMVADHILVTVPRATAQQVVAAAALRHGAQVRRRLGQTGTYVIGFPITGHTELPAMVAALTKDLGGKANVEPDWIVQAIGSPADPSFGLLWGMDNQGQSGGTVDADIDAPEAWEISTGSHAVLVGVIDTGIDAAHPDLAANMWTNPGESGLDAFGADRRTNGVDDDGNGYIDDWRGWDFVNNDNDPSDDHYHGTHCAGTIGAVGNNGTGVAGVCWDVSLVGLKFLSATGSGTTSAAIESVDYATIIGCDLTSNSWGGGGYSFALEEAINAADAAGIGFVAAAGNTATDNDVSPHYPSSYACSNIISVAATTSTDAMSSFSCYGALSVDLAAPGSSIYSTAPGGSYQYLSGTSMATPHVSGAYALMKSVSPGLDPEAVRQALIETVDVIPSQAGKSISQGRLNVAAAMAVIAGPVVQFGEVASTEVEGDQDGYFNPGEAVDLAVTLKGAGTEISTAVTAVLSSAQSEVSIEQSLADFGDLQPGSTVVGSLPFRIRLAEGTATPFIVDCALTVTSTNAGVRTFPVTVTYVTDAHIRGTVTDQITNAPVVGATVTVAESGPAVMTGADGSYDLVVIDGVHSVVASASGYLDSAPQQVTTPPDANAVDFVLGYPDIVVTPDQLTITVDQGGTATTGLSIANVGAGVLTYSLQGEAVAAPTPSGLWHISTLRQVTGQAWYYGDDIKRNYDTGTANSGTLDLGPVSVPVVDPNLYFQEWRNTEGGSYYDMSAVEVSVDGGFSWSVLYQSLASSSSEAFTPTTVSLAAYGGQTVNIRFRFDTKDAIANAFEGWFIDDIRIGQGAPGGLLAVAPKSGAVGAGDFTELLVTATPGDREPGTYNKSLTITSNDADEPEVVVPVQVVVQGAPKIEISGMQLAEVDGDGDGSVEPGESAGFAGSLQNIGVATATGLSATLTSTSPWVGIVEPTQSIGDLWPNTGFILSPWAVTIDAACPNNTALTFVVTVSDDAGRSWLGSLTTVVTWKGQVSGVITDISTGLPVASVYVSTAGKYAYTASDGSYLIDGIAAGTYPISASHYPHSTETSSISVPPNAVWSPQLGVRKITVNPPSYNGVVLSGLVLSVGVNITNTGTLPVDWSGYDYTSWITIIGGPGHLEPGESQTATIACYTTGMAYGTYTGYGYFKANGGNTVSVPITIGVASYSPPVADDLVLTTEEDTPVAITLSGVDSDGDPLTFSVLTQPTSGTLSGAPPNMTYTPAANVTGTVSFTYRAFDGYHYSLPATATVTVTPVNDPPTAWSSTVTVPMDRASSVRFGAQDPDGDDLIMTIVDGPEVGTLTVDGVIGSYTPPLGYQGSVEVVFTAADATVTTPAETLTIVVADSTGSWPTYGNLPTHTFYQPITLAPFLEPTKRWESTRSEIYQMQPVIGDGKVIVVSSGYFAPGYTTAYNLETGILEWEAATGSNYSANGATIADGKVYMQTCYQGTSYVWKFDAATGALDWKGQFSAQWEKYLAPCVVGNQVFINGGTYGGMYAFDTETGTSQWFAPLSQFNNWTPAFDQGVVYSYAGKVFAAHDPATGVKQWSLTLPDGQLSYSANQAPCIVDGFAYVVETYSSQDRLTCIDLSSHAVAWSTPTGAAYGPMAYGSVACANGVAYLATSSGVMSFDAQTGVPGIIYPAQSSLVATAPIITNDAMIIPRENMTFIFELGYTIPRHILQVGGYAALTGNTLVVTGNGKTSAWTLGNRSPNAYALTATTDEDVPATIPLYGTDQDKDALTWSVASQPSAGSVSITGSEATFTPPENGFGSYAFQVQASDGIATSTAEVIVEVLPVNDAPIASDGSATVMSAESVSLPVAATDIDSLTLSVELVSPPIGGQWVSNGDLSGIYTANSAFTGVDTFTVRVSDGEAWSSVVTLSVTVLPRFDAKINFQPSSAPVPAGYVVDSGSAFGVRSPSLSYGWNIKTFDTRYRKNANPDLRYATLNHMQKIAGRFWEIEVPNGYYALTIACGDPSYTDQKNTLDIEGTVIVDPDGFDHFDDYTVVVQVSDGRLTIKPAVAQGASNAKLCYLNLARVAPPVAP